MSDCDVAVIGAGHNGLVAAFYLARAGLRVHLFEARRRSGGAAITEELWPGAFFSTCAHVLHGVPPKIHRDLRLAARGLRVLPRSDFVSVNRDGTYWGPEDRDSPKNSTRELTGPEREGEGAYRSFRAALARIAARYRLRLPPGLPEILRDARDTEERQAMDWGLRYTSRQLRDMLLPTERLRDRHGADRAPIGRDPWALSYAADGMWAPDEETGEPYPHGYVRGGLGEFARTVTEAANEAGAQIHLSSPVAGCMLDGARVVGLRLRDGTEVRSRVVLSNRDPKATLFEMLPANAVPRYLAQRVAALPTDVSCYKLLALLSEPPRWTAWDGEPMERARGGTVLTHTRAEVAAAYDDAEAGRPPRAPTISFSVPSAIDPTAAPAGYHTASVWIYPAPARLEGALWREVRDRVAESLIDQITEYAPNFRRSIVNYRLRTPEDIARMHGMTDGCIWHVQHDGSALFANRPVPELAAYRAHLAGLYLCGAGQHPWGEVTGLPGHNAAQEVLKDLA